MPPKPTPAIRGVRYVDIRFAIPDDITIPSGAGAAGYIRPFTNTSMSKQSTSPYTFTPVSPHVGSNGLGSPPMSPFAVRKSTPSPAFTATTADSSECSVNSHRAVMIDSQMISPLTIFEGEVCSSVALPGKTTPKPSASLKFAIVTEQKKAAKSPFAQQKDDLGRKQRVKTELCMHVERGTTCPFGKECVFAHSEEELRLTKLLDLVCAGMVDGETFRAKPCQIWVATGSW